jgi:hypothetical protein
MLIHSPQPWSDFRGGDYAELIAYCQDKDILGPGRQVRPTMGADLSRRHSPCCPAIARTGRLRGINQRTMGSSGKDAIPLPRCPPGLFQGMSCRWATAVSRPISRLHKASPSRLSQPAGRPAEHTAVHRDSRNARSTS